MAEKNALLQQNRNRVSATILFREKLGDERL